MALGTERKKGARISGSEARTWLQGSSGMFWLFCLQSLPRWGGKQHVGVEAG